VRVRVRDWNAISGDAEFELFRWGLGLRRNREKLRATVGAS
jgi:hypothetical protein